MIFNTHYSYFDEPCLTFSSASPFSITIPSTSTYEGSLYYSTDRLHWNLCTKGNAINSNSNGQIYMRGLGNTTICGNNRTAQLDESVVTTDSWIYSGSNYVDVIGNIEMLLDYKKVKKAIHPSMREYCFCLLFYNWDKLRRAPALPATTLVDRSYAGMFWGCTSLTTAPALPAITLAASCYYSMFRRCTSLTTAPALLATTLAQLCYAYMFNECTSLTAVPTLPATTLATFCYRAMFRGCTSLTTAPALPAITLAIDCYEGMFSNCTSLTTAPALPATTLVSGCYENMFSSCSNLAIIPRLRATSVPSNGYLGMFRNCTKVKIYATTASGLNTYYVGDAVATNSLQDMFTGTGGTFTGTPVGNATYYTSNSVV